jgi:hypothetical protein
MAVDNTAKSNGRGGKAIAQKSRSSRSAKSQETSVPPTEEPITDELSTEEPIREMPDDGLVVEAEVSEAATEVSEVKQSPKEDVKSEPAMSTDGVVKITARPAQAEEGAIALSEPVNMVWNRPVMPSDIEVAETMSVAGVRPIAVSHLELAGSFLNGRPIESSGLKVRDMLPGDRPIFVSDFHMMEGAMLPGNRPIQASRPELMEASVLPGNRPIFSNEVIDPEPSTLMGYLD